MYEKIKNITSLIRNNLFCGGTIATPSVAIILGSGLGGLADELQNAVSISYADIPDFPRSTVAGHSGRLIYGTLDSTPVMVMSGRVHFYEGYSMEQVVLPIRVLGALGVRTVILSNAAGGIDTSFSAGDLMLITDHINMMPNPLIGPNDEKLGTRFPSMHNAYDADLRELALKKATQLNITLKQGVYLALTGPSYETPAEYKFFRTIGASAVGMSTVPEVIAARHMNLRILALSLISNVVGVNAQISTSHEEVQQIGAQASQKMTSLVKSLLNELD